MEYFDLIVIGGGSAGMKAARTARKYGKTVAIVEERELGGECFWAGCVPTKALIRAAEAWKSVADLQKFGVAVETLSRQFSDAMAYKNRAVREVGGDPSSDGGLGKAGITYFHSSATFVDENSLSIDGAVFEFGHCVIATGTNPFVPKIPGLQAAGFLTNREVLELKELPDRIAVFGGGPIGLEFGQVFQRFGAQVTIFEQSSDIMAHEEPDVAALAHQFLAAEGIEILTGTKVSSVSKLNGTKQVTYFHGEEILIREFDEILVATGRTAAVDHLNLEAAGVKLCGHYVETDVFLQTANPKIYAAGDVNGGYLFTHVASYEGKLVADNIFGKNSMPSRPKVVPRCTYIDPEVASAGMTTAEAVQFGVNVGVQIFPFSYSDRAIIYGDSRGFVKLISDLDDDKLIGAHIISHAASSLIAEAALAIQHDLPASAIAETMHAYPSFPEAVESAALAEIVRTDQ